MKNKTENEGILKKCASLAEGEQEIRKILQDIKGVTLEVRISLMEKGVNLADSIWSSLSSGMHFF